MAIKATFQGHWRALESAWLEHLRGHRTSINGFIHRTAVIVAGQPLSKHLLNKIDFTAAGITFFPGIPKLAEALSSTITVNKIPTSNLISLAATAGCKTSNLKASVKFFEKMLEMGVTSDTFSVVIQSTRGMHTKVKETAKLFAEYSRQRNRYYPTATSEIMDIGPVNAKRFDSYIFYGFYDLNPAQRKYVKLLAENADVFWFSPLHSSNHFAAPFFRTSNLLNSLSTTPPKRVDLTTTLTQVAQFGTNLLMEKTLLQNSQIELIHCGSGIGFTNAVSTCLKNNLTAFEASEIAVIASGEDAKLIITELYSQGIPSKPSITIEANQHPIGSFIKNLLELSVNQFHHFDIERLLYTGFIKLEDTPDAIAYSKKANKLGARFGLDSLLKTGYDFAMHLANFFTTLPIEAEAAVYLQKLIDLLRTLSCDTLPDLFHSEILDVTSFYPRETISYQVFIQMVGSTLETPISLSDSEAKGIQILPIEKARGISCKVIIVTGMEEGIFPRSGLNDPRLPVEVKKQLQLPSLETKEVEDGYLLSQLFEAAEKQLIFISRTTDTKGKPLALSHFIQPLKSSKKLVKVANYSDSPLHTLNIPQNPPFLNSSLNAQKERLAFNPNNPEKGATHCGMIGEKLYTPDHITATMLENYLRNPYNFMVDRLWDVQQEDEFPIRSQPPPMDRGKIVHSCVEEALKTSVPIVEIVNSVCKKCKLNELLGSVTLAELWKEHLIISVKKLKKEIMDRDWSLIDTEKQLDGTIAGIKATGKIDLIFKDNESNYILADLKTGRPKKVRNSKGLTILKNNLLQLPFYWNLAKQNSYNHISLALYIHLESKGSITFLQITGTELQSVNNSFEALVTETVHSMISGDFHKPLEKDFVK